MKNCEEINNPVLRTGLFLLCMINKAWDYILNVKSQTVMKDQTAIH